MKITLRNAAGEKKQVEQKKRTENGVVAVKVTYPAGKENADK